MTRPLPRCRFCGADLRRAKARILISEGKRGERRHWGCCDRPECMDQFDLHSPEARHRREAEHAGPG